MCPAGPVCVGGGVLNVLCHPDPKDFYVGELNDISNIVHLQFTTCPQCLLTCNTYPVKWLDVFMLQVRRTNLTDINFEYSAP